MLSLESRNFAPCDDHQDHRDRDHRRINQRQPLRRLACLSGTGASSSYFLSVASVPAASQANRARESHRNPVFQGHGPHLHRGRSASQPKTAASLLLALGGCKRLCDPPLHISPPSTAPAVSQARSDSRGSSQLGGFTVVLVRSSFSRKRPR